MPRQKKPGKALNCILQIDIWTALDQYCEKTGSNKTFVAERAIKEFLDKYDEQQQVLKKHKLI